MAVEITSREELKDWLEDRPREWAHMIALRSALRVLPLSCDPASFKDRTVNPRLPLAVFRASAILSGAAGSPPDNIAAAVRAVLKLATDGPSDASVPFSAAVAVAFAAASAYTPSSGDSASLAAAAAVRAVADAADTDTWQFVESDCRALGDGTEPGELSRLHLWPIEPEWWSNSWDAARRWLSRLEDGFEIWREWYYGRIESLPHAFADFDDSADEAFYRWIVEQNDDWWERDPAEVNAEIANFVDGLRRKSPVARESPSSVIVPDPQVEAVPTITRSRNDKLTLLRVSASVDESAKRRHKGARNRVEALKQFMDSTNYGAEFSAICEHILESLGTNLEHLDGDGIVLNADSLRVEFETQQHPGRGDDWEPLSGKPLRLVADAISALNLLIGSDATLEARETIRLGPDTEREIAEPNATIELVDALKADDLSEQDVDNAARRAAKNAPTLPDPTNRRTALVTEFGLNFVRWTVNFIVDYEEDLTNYGALAGAAGFVIDPLTTGAGAYLAWKLAKNVHQNRERWRRIAAQARVTKQNFERLLEILDRLPLD